MTYLLEFAEDWAPVAFDERAVEHVPDHPIATIAPPSQLAPPPPKGFHLLATLDDFAVLPDGAPRPRDLADGRYWQAADAVVHLAAVRDLITARPELVANPVLRRDVVAQLLEACDAIASVGAPVRFVTDNS